LLHPSEGRTRARQGGLDDRAVAVIQSNPRDDVLEAEGLGLGSRSLQRVPGAVEGQIVRRREL